MTDTTIAVPGRMALGTSPQLKRLGELLKVAVKLLADLPAPRFVSVYRACQDISLGFGTGPEALDALTRWGSHYDQPVTRSPYTREDGEQLTYCTIEFTYMGVSVKACAFIPADTAIPHADYPHLPGRLHDCPACMARCHCTPGDAPCVYDGPHNTVAAT